MSKTRMIKIADVAVVLLLASLISSAPALAQGYPRGNVNIVGMTPDPDDFPDEAYRQQNEPACARRNDDSACTICAYNDYRAVDDIGDAWIGVSQSCDNESWRSRLAPGYPGDTSAAPIPAEFAADARLVAIPGVGNPGMAILSFIANSRDGNSGQLAIQHWLDVVKEDADHYEPGRVTYFADSGTSGRLLDKPDMFFKIDPPGPQGTIRLSTDMENRALGVGGNGTINRYYPSGTLYVAYAVFTGSSSIKVLVKVSQDLGETFKNQTLKLSEDQNEVSGISLTAAGDKVLAVWRRLGDNNNPDSIMYSVISNNGRKATKAEVLADLCAFDQPTLAGQELIEGEGPLVSFRSNDFPWTATDGDNLFVFYSDAAQPDGSCDGFGRPRIVMHHSSDAGVSWNTEGPIPLVKPADVPADSFQLMPAAFGANGKVQVAWYDTRREAFGGVLTPWPFVVDYNVDDAAYIQRTVDVYTTSVTMDNGVPVVPSPVRVSQYNTIVDASGQNIYEVEANLANKKLFSQGLASFIGDYIAVAARQFRRTADGTEWETNFSAIPGGGHEDFFIAYTDNRDVLGEISDITQPFDYGFAALEDEGDSDPLMGETQKQMLAGTQPAVRTGPPQDKSRTTEGLEGGDREPSACGPTTERARDSNIYGSLIKDEAGFYASTPSKPLSGLTRAFAVSLSNATDGDQIYTLEILNQPCSLCVASFRQQSLRLGEELTVLANSSSARTIFLTIEGDPLSVVPVKVQARIGTDVVATIELGNSTVFVDPENCPEFDTSCAVATNELHNLQLQTVNSEAAAAWLNAALLNAALLNTSVSAAELLTADWLNAALLNADLLNANLLNPTLLALALEGAVTDANCETDYSSLCAGDPNTATVADVINYAVDNPETINAALLNAALLNAALLNANLLNANLLNANLLNANLLNANLLNADLLNANLLNADLLNANLLNADLLNANLLNADLLNADLLNADLLNADLLNATIFNASLLNATLEDPLEPLTVTYDDYTYPVTNNGNVTTAINADITINVPLALDVDGNPVVDEDGNPVVDADGNPVPDVLGTKLMAWTVNATPTTIGCVDRVQLDTRVQAIVPNPDSDLEEARITSPFEGEVSVIAAAGETVFITLRVVGTLEQLRNVRVSGFTAAAQAANCKADGTFAGFGGCAESLRTDSEKILFKDLIPPTLNINGDNPMTLEAGVEPYIELGATAIDNIDGDISAKVEIGGDIVLDGTVGRYDVLYNITDSVGNMADTKTRVVHVADNIAPVITLYGQATVTLEAGKDDYTELSAKVEDKGNPLTMVDIGGDTVDTDVVGTYVVTYNANDGLHDAVEVIRTVTVNDTSSPEIVGFNFPGSLTPSSPQPLELLDADAKTITVTWPISVADADPNVTINCSANGTDLVRVGDLAVNGNQVTATFSHDFPVGFTTVTCTATDTTGNRPTEIEFTLEVLDVWPPVISVPSEPVLIGLPVILLDGTESFEYDYSGHVSVSDVVDDSPTLECRTGNAAFGSTFTDTFNYGDTTVECRAKDTGLNESTAEFVIRARYPYDIQIFLPKGVAKIGSTIPLDWQYYAWDGERRGLPIDSSALAPRITWATTTNDCAGEVANGIKGEDSGSSKFRYSSSNMLWQYSLQTKDADFTKDKYLITISPPGKGVPGASACITLK